VRLQGANVILVGTGEAADAKRRLLERAGALVVGEEGNAALAIVASEDSEEAEAAVARLKARGVLVNAVDRVALCDFTLPAIVDRDPVLVAIGTGGASAGLAKALRQRFEMLLPQTLGTLATALGNARAALRAKHPDAADRRKAIDDALREGGALDPFGDGGDVSVWRAGAADAVADRTETILLTSSDPDNLTLKQARLLGGADRVYHAADVPAAILDRARADAVRIVGAPPAMEEGGLTLIVAMA
jgi:uroporphyrin-III C-methyltransferase / precorrin-2 dehydrogenase / sirohydrochlorin ferrochelatase